MESVTLLGSLSAALLDCGGFSCCFFRYSTAKGEKKKDPLMKKFRFEQLLLTVEPLVACLTVEEMMSAAKFDAGRWASLVP